MELRRLVLTEELLGLPAIVRELADAQQRTERQVRELIDAQQRTELQVRGLIDAQQRTELQVRGLIDAQQRTERQVRELAEAQQRTEQEVRALAEAQQRTETRLDGIEQHLGEFERRTDRRFDRLEQQVGELRGSDRERRYRDHASAYFGRLLRRVRMVAAAELDDLLDEGLASGALDEETVQDVRWADLIVGGRRPGDDRDTYLVVEVSVAIGPDDVERAARRAAALGRLRPALAVVAGDRLTSEAAALAEARGVWRMLDGRLEAPGSDA